MKEKYESLEISIQNIFEDDVITASAGLPTQSEERENRYFDFFDFS